MNIGEEAAVGIGALLTGWLGSAFFHGRKVGAVEQQLIILAKSIETHDLEIKTLKANSDAELQTLRVTLEAEIAKLRVDHEEDIDRFQIFFTAPGGGQKFITFPDHESMCGKNIKPVVQAVESLTIALRENTEIVQRMGDKIHILDVDVAVLKDRREKGQRQANGEG